MLYLHRIHTSQASQPLWLQAYSTVYQHGTDVKFGRDVPGRKVPSVRKIAA